jgi:hypothetical protein
MMTSGVAGWLTLAVLATAVDAGATPPPWARTETRQSCTSFDPLRQPFFGDLHVHTRYSADAYIGGTRTEPHDAYAFARGESIVLPDEQEGQTRATRLDRPLDFAAVTDHAEWFGEANLCATPGSVPYDFDICRIFRQAELPGTSQFDVTVRWLFPAGIANPPPSLPFCNEPGVECDDAAVSAWQAMQGAAEEAYDRTAACTFTSFVGYEHTNSPIGRHLHRNVIFRNANVPPFAYSQLETWRDGVPQGVWKAVEENCLDAGTGCDALIIPHNPNLSEGRQFEDPLSPEDALRRQTMEPLVEMFQLKAGSECRFDRLAGLGVGTTDELCTFEQNLRAHQGPDATVLPIDQYPRRNLVRNTLKDGLAFDRQWGVNPWKLGFIGSTDTHESNPGNVAERMFLDVQGNSPVAPGLQIENGLRSNPGGLAVVWAEENSRDALFAGLRRRETFATSGTRPLVRFFAGTLDEVRCGQADFVARAYRTATPMGGDVGPASGRRGPRFAVWAAKDPGTGAQAGTDLQRVQIVKGWVDDAGDTHEKVFDVVGNAANGAGVDPATCQPTGAGAAELCAVWRDPDFDPDARAFYYGRVLENPSCRWSTLVCKASGVDPFSPACAEQATVAGAAFADCCLGTDNDPFLEPVIQERAWTSPVWYRPDGIARLRGRIARGKRAGADTLSLRVWFGPDAALDLATQDLTVRVADDDDIWTVTIPAGTLRPRRGGMLVFADRRGRLAGLRRAVFATPGRRTRLLRLTVVGDFGRADAEDHAVTVSLASGLYRATHARWWTAQGKELAGG